jgi:hypothetical protein
LLPAAAAERLWLELQTPLSGVSGDETQLELSCVAAAAEAGTSPLDGEAHDALSTASIPEREIFLKLITATPDNYPNRKLIER